MRGCRGCRSGPEAAVWTRVLRRRRTGSRERRRSGQSRRCVSSHLAAVDSLGHLSSLKARTATCITATKRRGMALERRERHEQEQRRPRSVRRYRRCHRQRAPRADRREGQGPISRSGRPMILILLVTRSLLSVGPRRRAESYERHNRAFSHCSPPSSPSQSFRSCCVVSPAVWAISL
jgi:hypothetical protein